MTADLDEYCHRMLFAAERIATATRSEDPSTVAAEIREALAVPAPHAAPALCSCAVPRLDPAAVYTLLAALAVQVDVDETTVRQRSAWTLDIAAITPVPPRTLASSAHNLPVGRTGMSDGSIGGGVAA